MPDSNDVLLEASSLTRTLGTDAGVFDLSLTIKRGEIVGLLGLNGAGKSSTLRLLSGLLTPDSGDVRIAGYSIQEEPLEARARLGYLPDQPPLYNDMRVAEYLKLCALVRRVDKKAVSQSVTAVVEQCDLGSVSRQRIATLSKGYKQRVGLAQALIHEPDVLLLDEPSSGLDPQQMQGMREILKNVQHKQCVVFSTHLLNEAQAVCNRIALVNTGRIVHEAEVSDDNAALETLFTGLLDTAPAEAQSHD